MLLGLVLVVLYGNRNMLESLHLVLREYGLVAGRACAVGVCKNSAELYPSAARTKTFCVRSSVSGPNIILPIKKKKELLVALW